MSTRFAWWFTAAVVLGASACYSYTPADPAAVSPGTEVRARLTPEGMGRAAGRFARPTRQLDGTVVATRADTLVLSAWQADRHSRLAFEPVSDTVSLAPVHIAELQTRRLSYVRTGLLVGGIGVGLYLIADAVIKGEQQGGNPRPDTPVFLVVPLRFGGSR